MLPSLSREATLVALPPAWPDDLLPALASAVRTARKLVVLDDDPTGTQTVYDITVVTEWSVETLAAELQTDRPGFYVLTNSRSLAPQATAALHTELATNLRTASQRTGVPFSLISRSDSTLRGHFPLETDTLNAALGPYDGILLIPYFEAGGRLTIDGIHYVAEGDRLMPAGSTPFARDATFGYRNSRLSAWIEEKTKGRIPADDVVHLPLELIRQQGPVAVATFLGGVTNGSVVVCDAVTQRDIEVLALGIMKAEASGKTFLGRTAASLVAARLGLAPRPLLESSCFHTSPDAAGGLVVVGSYVPKSTAQLNTLNLLESPRKIVLSVTDLLNPAKRDSTVADAVQQVTASLQHETLTVLSTSRHVITGSTPEESLAIINQVSTALVAVIRALTVRPRFLIAKGGITSSDIATAGLNVRRANVRGQLLPGVPVWQLGEESKFPGLDYVIFPGNVGNDTALADAVSKFQAPPI